MKKILMVVLFLFSSVVVANTGEFKLPVLGVKDGDTIATKFYNSPPGLQDIAVRIYGVDTPEKGFRAKCPSENEKAQKASAFVKKLVGDAKEMTVTNCKHDKYGGRIVCEVTINGKNIGQELIKAGLAREYYGDKKKSWCEL